MLGQFVLTCHAFRMETFFLLAGFFSRLIYEKRGGLEFLKSRLIRLGVPFVAGWFVIHPLIVASHVMASLEGSAGHRLHEGLATELTLGPHVMRGVFTQTHLWFLYYLLIITSVVLAAWKVIATHSVKGSDPQKNLDRVTPWLSRSRWSLPLLILITAGLIIKMRMWGVDTPDASLRPMILVMGLYGLFFAVGWLFATQPPLLETFARLTFLRGVTVVVAIVATLFSSRFQGFRNHAIARAAHVGFAIGYATMAWCLALLTIGIFRRYLRSPRFWPRYLADASYWIYLVHLPLIVLMQAALLPSPWHWTLKLSVVVFVAMIASIVTYDLFVRSTAIGWLLNGHKKEPALFRRLFHKRSSRDAFSDACR